MVSKKKGQILKEVPSEEKIQISKVLDKIVVCENKHLITFTDFLDLNKLTIIKNILDNNITDIRYKICGGYRDSERNIIGFYHDYEQLFDDDFPIDLIHIDVKNNKFNNTKLSHRDYLGTILGLGIERLTVGDIVVEENGAYVFVASHISDYITMNLSKVKRNDVLVSKKHLKDIKLPEPDYKEVNTTIASMRLDAVISSAFSISRGQATKLIKAGKVFVNWSMKDSVAFTVGQDDIVTLRGSGRIKIVTIGNMTKKGRTHLTLYRYL